MGWKRARHLSDFRRGFSIKRVLAVNSSYSRNSVVTNNSRHGSILFIARTRLSGGSRREENTARCAGSRLRSAWGEGTQPQQAHSSLKFLGNWELLDEDSPGAWRYDG
jgi:hypothetical protein